MAPRKGLFIALYGPDGTGKSKLMNLVEERLRERGVLVRALRYPIYDLKPTGAKLDEILHKKKLHLPEDEMQKLFAQNRKDFESTLRSWLDSGVTVVAENYKGTGMVWGVLRGLGIEQMEEINKDSMNPDIAVFIDGPMKEESHPLDHPYGDEEEWYRARKMYLQMADRYGWVRVGGDAPMLTVANRIWAVIKPVIER